MYQVDGARRFKPCRYENINSLERSVICNGCGGKGGRFNPPEYNFTCDCNHHDFNYWLGGTKRDRKKADVQFLKALLVSANRMAWYDVRRYWRRGAAYRYYWAVRAFGGKFFSLHKVLGVQSPETNKEAWTRLERLMDWNA